MLLAGAAGVLLLSGASFAQVGIGGIYGMGGGNTSIVGTVQGTVQNVNLRTGQITISSASGAGGAQRAVTLQARPFDLAYVNPGDVVSLSYSNYNGVLWLAPDQLGIGGGIGSIGGGIGGGIYGNTLFDWAQYGRVTGAVTSVDRQRGLISVRGQTYRAHPVQTQGVFPGQFVSLTFAQIGNQPWVSEVGDASSGGLGLGGYNQGFNSGMGFNQGFNSGMGFNQGFYSGGQQQIAPQQQQIAPQQQQSAPPPQQQQE